METPFNITREEVLELAANKLADQYDGESLYAYAKQRIEKSVNELVGNNLKERVDAFLVETLDKVTREEINPVNIWGEREGRPTTIRAFIADRAKDFWNVKVNKDGKEGYYGGKPRYEVLGKNILQAAFDEAFKENADQIVAEFKKALTADMQIKVAEHINKLIPKK